VTTVEHHQQAGRPPAVAVVGEGVAADAAVGSLLELGVTRVDLVASDSDAAARIAELRAAHPAAVLDVHPGWLATGKLWDAPWLVACDICLLAVDTVDAARCLELNAACQAARVALVPGLCMGDVAQVGPRITPGSGEACLQCIEIRVQTALGRTALAGPLPPGQSLARIVGRMLAVIATTVEAAGADNPLVYVWSDGRQTRHFPLRTVRCPACGCCEPRPHFAAPRQFDVSRSDADDPHRILRLQPFLVDSVVGVVPWLSTSPGDERQPAVTHAVASIADPVWARLGHPLYAGGSDCDPDRAVAAALGEALDRISTADPGPDHVRVATFGEVAEEAIDPRRFDLFDEQTRGRPEFPFVDFAPDAPMSWVWAWSAAEERPVLVPAARVLLPFSAVTTADHADIANISGCATGTSLVTAALGGLLEVIERDTFMIAWMARLPLARVHIDERSSWEIGEYVAAFNATGREVRCATITLDWGIPLVVAIAASQHPSDPAAVVAAAAHPDLAHACRRALKELSANLAHVRHTMAEATALPDPDPSQIRTQEAHALLFARPDMFPHLEGWWAPARSVSLPAPENDPPAEVFERITRGLARRGGDALLVDLSMSQLRGRGLWTVKSLVPGAYPMNFDALWPHLGGDRLRSAAVELGVRPEPMTIEQLHHVPHPFP
jgi:ribosomal protein S12 methylthiotransferase accessory factor